MLAISGSSPWIRGTRLTQFQSQYCRRFIPVDTGNTLAKPIRPQKSPVHPRGYGEHALGWSGKQQISGSSPWIRGTLSFIILIQH